MMEKWKIWIDTGGTFTDCVAFDPMDQLHRVKILSKSALRGRILRILDRDVVEFSSSDALIPDIFTDYRFSILGYDHAETKIVARVPGKNIFHLDRGILSSGFKSFDFEITAEEEAPLLAARIVTRTPLAGSFPPLEMRLGSTIGTNALLERKGAETALIVTGGFKDLLRIGNQQRPDIFSLNIEKPDPLYTVVFELEERCDRDGNPLTVPDENGFKDIQENLDISGCKSVAISLLHSYRNQEHELKLKNYLKHKGYPFVTCSAEIVPLIHYLNRTETTVVNAYLAPRVEKYLAHVNRKLEQGSLRIMTSAGGLVKHDFYLPKDSLFSGPAGGVVGAAETGKKAGITNLLTFDMGGTSTDVARYDGKYEYQFETRIENATVISPSLHIETVASGGGSICQFDGYKFIVGPESAGSSPGPACYGEGGPLTITDVNLLLGRLAEDNFGIPIYRNRSERAFDDVLKKYNTTGMVPEKILNGFIQIVNEKMAGTIRKISVNKGYDPSQYTLVSFGGAGGQHAVDLAAMLNIRTILIPYDASLLSATGMGYARIERFAVKQVLEPLRQLKDLLPDLIGECCASAIRELEKENIRRDDIEISQVLLYLRFKGQESTLEIEYGSGKIREKFKNLYQKRYGHWISGRIIEVESIKAIATDIQKREKEKKPKIRSYLPDPGKFQKTFINDSWQNIAVYEWEKLLPGAILMGPCLLTSQYSTVVIPNDWEFRINEWLQAMGQKLKIEKPGKISAVPVDTKADPVNLELFTNRFSSIAEEMGALLRRTSFSVNIRERLDFSCALLDESGELVVNAPHIPVHLGGLGLCVRRMMERFDFRPDDIVITNHPGFGGSHLPDITLVAPVFDQQKNLVGFVANRAHHAELGGKRPGSMPPEARNLAEEGIVIFPAYLKKGKTVFWDDIINNLSAGPFPTRSLEENLADLNGSMASIQTGVQSFKKLCSQFGTSTVRQYMQELKKLASGRLISSLSRFQGMDMAAEENLDDGSPVRVRISLGDQEILFDFSGSAPVHAGNLNATPAIVRSAVIYVLRLMIRDPLPLNEGIMENVRILLPEGMLNPRFPDDPALCPAVVGGNTETSQRIVDTLLKALGLAACSQGTMNNLLFGDHTFSYYETICGGVGATEGNSGASAVHQHMTNTRITDPEILEFRYPVRLDHFYIRENSGGMGKWCGGNGVSRKITFLEAMEITLLSQHRLTGPFGFAGGGSGSTGDQWIIRKNVIKEQMSGIDGKQVYPGDSVVVLTPGGGGWGVPE
jgi:5-oxoprolinase (ATP-hydrolysing)